MEHARDLYDRFTDHCYGEGLMDPSSWALSVSFISMSKKIVQGSGLGGLVRWHSVSSSTPGTRLLGYRLQNEAAGMRRTGS